MLEILKIINCVKKWAQTCLKMFPNHMYLIYMYKEDLALNSGSTWLVVIYGLNRTKQCTYTKLNCLK